MPDTPSAQLEWNQENLANVIADLYREAEVDQALHTRLMTAPFDVLSSRIAVPQEYSGGIFTREKGQQTLMLYVPSFGAMRQALPAGTSEVQPQPDFDLVCTSDTLW